MKKGELVARLESQELEAQKRQYVAARDQVVAQLENARLDRNRAKSLLDEKIGSQQAFDAADAQVRALAAQAASAEQQIKLHGRAHQERRDLRADRRRRDREEGVPRRDGRPAGLRRRRLGRRDVRRHRRPLLPRDGGRHQRAERREALDRAAGRGRARRVPGQAVQGAPAPDRPDGGPAEGLREGQDRDLRQGRQGAARDVLPRRLPEPRGEGRREGEAEGHGAGRVRRRRSAARRASSSSRTTRRRSARSSSARPPGAQVEVASGVSGGEEIVADAATASHAWRREQKVRLKKD